MYDLAQAIKDLIIEYDKACKLDFVNFPIDMLYIRRGRNMI